MDFGGEFNLTGMDQLARVHLGVPHAGECVETLKTLPLKSLRTLHLTIGSKHYFDKAPLPRLLEVLAGIHKKMNNKPLGFWTNLGHDETKYWFKDFVNREGITIDKKLFVG